MTLLYIMISSGIGAVCRQFVNVTLTKYFAYSFPIATLVVNILGSLMIGFVAQYLNSSSLSYAIIALGFCGGFTTFSTHILEIYEQYLLKSYKKLIIYLLLTIILSIGSCYLGYHI
ncbi:CrcB family protein [Mammaliicoccus fleurettii]|uniref:Fluoride-specific ion channel FluC n=2 Tax=Staphylococcaceae TaxID=90964 RepID=A0ABS5MLV0_9STAP|nr:CrcB family protein [Mammaliicoccus fleurettii]MBL0847144.1 CrcB family protein [Mammaliicoccus fleurettii]MBS3671861.1 CrcB family protein [Mammaliicoccus fleurettii]MBS3696888.1 CrcB family protein [Mammaliicoccus fleurettii]